MKTSQYPSAGKGEIVLNQFRINAGSGVPAFGIRFHEEATGVAEYDGLDD